jgi:hypothetical protein
VNSPNCFKRDRDIFIKLTNNEYIVGTARDFQINGVVISPNVGG